MKYTIKELLDKSFDIRDIMKNKELIKKLILEKIHDLAP
jgi:hypothetical protein